MENFSVGNLVVSSLIAGVFGTLGMSVFLYVISKSVYKNTDMVKALGSLVTKSLNNAFQVGISLHIISGIVFAFIYAIILAIFNVHGLSACLGGSLIIGFIHGGVVSFLLIPAVAESHPLHRFRIEGFSVAIAYWAAHIVYGLIVGIIIGAVGL
jgi:hypothetical protein